MEQRYFKFLTPERTGGYSNYRWPEIDVWTPPAIGTLELCRVGYHILTTDQILGNYMQAELYEVAWYGDIMRDDEKCAVRQAKLIRKIETWNDRTDRIFSADCAERVLPIYEKQYPDEKRVRACIQAARDFADGKITQAELAAAGDAAWAAAGAAAGAAARDAAWAAAGAAARAAAGAAARAAARDAAWAAAWAAERKWQSEHLREMLGIY